MSGLCTAPWMRKRSINLTRPQWPTSLVSGRPGQPAVIRQQPSGHHDSERFPTYAEHCWRLCCQVAIGINRSRSIGT